jgi:hypothetical protein
MTCHGVSRHTASCLFQLWLQLQKDHCVATFRFQMRFCAFDDSSQVHKTLYSSEMLFKFVTSSHFICAAFGLITQFFYTLLFPAQPYFVIGTAP